MESSDQHAEAIKSNADEKAPDSDTGCKNIGADAVWREHLRLGVAVNMQSEAKRNEFTELGGSEDETKGEEESEGGSFFDRGGRANVDQLPTWFFKKAPQPCLFLDLNASPRTRAPPSASINREKIRTDLQNATASFVYSHWLKCCFPLPEETEAFLGRSLKS